MWPAPPGASTQWWLDATLIAPLHQQRYSISNILYYPKHRTCKHHLPTPHPHATIWGRMLSVNICVNMFLFLWNSSEFGAFLIMFSCRVLYCCDFGPFIWYLKFWPFKYIGNSSHPGHPSAVRHLNDNKCNDVTNIGAVKAIRSSSIWWIHKIAAYNKILGRVQIYKILLMVAGSQDQVRNLCKLKMSI